MLFLILQVLDLKEQVQKLICSGNMVDVDGEYCLQSLVAAGVFVHGSVVNGVPLHVVLLCENLSVPIDHIRCILFKQIEHIDVEVFEPLNSFSIVEDGSS